MSLSSTSLNIVTAAPARAAATGMQELAWTMLGNVVLHASLIAVASIIPVRSAAWMLSAAAHNPPSGDNTIELSAAFLDAAAATPEERADVAPAMVMQVTPVSTEGSSEIVPREIDLSPLAMAPAPQGANVDSDSLAEAAAENKVADLKTERRENPQQPQVAEAPEKAGSTPSRSTAAAPPAVGSPDALPSEVHSPFPAYPPELLARRIQATVVLRLKIATDGSIVEATVHRTSGYEAMDQAAINGVKSWKFRPAMKNGKPIESIVRKPFAFEIRE